MNGEIGCISNNIFLIIYFEILNALLRRDKFELLNLSFAISIYQLQNSFQVKSYIFIIASLNRYYSNDLFTSLIVSSNEHKIHLSKLSISS